MRPLFVCRRNEANAQIVRTKSFSSRHHPCLGPREQGLLCEFSHLKCQKCPANLLLISLPNHRAILIPDHWYVHKPEREKWIKIPHSWNKMHTHLKLRLRSDIETSRVSNKPRHVYILQTRSLGTFPPTAATAHTHDFLMQGVRNRGTAAKRQNFGAIFCPFYVSDDVVCFKTSSLSSPAFPVVPFQSFVFEKPETKEPTRGTVTQQREREKRQQGANSAALDKTTAAARTERILPLPAE